MHFAKLPLPRKLYILLTLIISIAFLGVSYTDAVNSKQLMYKEKERTLIEIATLLEQKIPRTYDDILKEEGVFTLSSERKKETLRRRLQPIINEVGEQYPGYYMVYGD